MINSKRMYLVNILMEVLPNAGLQRLKTTLMRWAGVNVGKDVEFFQGVKIQGIGEIIIEDKVFIGHEVLFMINQGSRILVDESSVISSRCTIMTGFHPITPDGERIISREGTTSNVTIGKGCAILAGSLVLPGVTIGEKALVAAGATVAKDVEPFTLVGGCPAKLIKKYEA